MNEKEQRSRIETVQSVHSMPAASEPRFLAEQAADYLAQRMGERISVAALSRQLHVSQTHLQQAFRRTYGLSVYAYRKHQRMWAAALRLLHTNQTVMEIAGSLGYENASKFACAFRAVIGMSPAKFRKQYAQQGGAFPSKLC